VFSRKKEKRGESEKRGEGGGVGIKRSVCGTKGPLRSVDQGWWAGTEEVGGWGGVKSAAKPGRKKMQREKKLVE